MKTGPEASNDHTLSNGRKRASAASPEEQSGLKRSRVSRACDQCRASREKCDGKIPLCETCSSQRRECTYIEQPKRRGIQPHYIRTLEMLLALLFRTYGPSEATLAATLASLDDTTQKILSGKDGPGAEALHQSWRDSIINRQVDQMLSGVTIESPGPDARAGKTFTNMLQAVETPAQAYMSPHVQGSHNTHAPDSIGATQDIWPAQSLNTQIDAGITVSSPPLPVVRHKLPVNAWTLLEYHFAFTLAWLPVTDKQAMLKLMYTFPAEGLTEHELTQSSDYAELLSIMALATKQTQAGTETERLQDLVLSLVPPAQSVDASHARSLIILCLFQMSNDEWLAAWTILGTAIRHLLVTISSNAQHADASSSMLAAFVLESAIASKLRLTPHLRPYAIEAVGTVQEDGLAEWSPWHDPLGQPTDVKAPARSLSTFNTLVRIATACFDGKGQLLLENGGSEHPFRPGIYRTGTASSNAIDRTVSQLLQNAARLTGRRHPKDVVAACDAGNVLAGPSAPVMGGAAVQQTQDFAFMTVPTHDSSETVFESALSGEEGGSATWPQNAAQIPSQLPDFAPLDSGSISVDLFEELAMLERTNSSQHPQFMQNLGFAPDLDLAEFFGADYQPSDPLLAYMQPSLFNNTDSTTGEGNADIG